MSVLKPAKMTTKTRKTLELASEVLNVKMVHLRKDRAAIDEMTRYLENEGFEWVAQKQEWARVSPPLAIAHMRYFALTCQVAHVDIMLMLLEAGAQALGVTVKLNQRLDTVENDQTTSALLMEMTE